MPFEAVQLAQLCLRTRGEVVRPAVRNHLRMGIVQEIMSHPQSAPQPLHDDPCTGMYSSKTNNGVTNNGVTNNGVRPAQL